MPHEYDVTLGALLIGLSVACGVFGVLTSQTITYYQRYFHDKWLYKTLVSAQNSMQITRNRWTFVRWGASGKHPEILPILLAHLVQACRVIGRDFRRIFSVPLHNFVRSRFATSFPFALSLSLQPLRRLLLLHDARCHLVIDCAFLRSFIKRAQL